MLRFMSSNNDMDPNSNINYSRKIPPMYKINVI